MLLDALLVLGGIGLLYVGAEALVRGASALALRYGMSPLVVGLTVVAFGTSAPELVVSIQAALAGQGGIAVGNVVGSNVANVGLILGVAALIRPLRVDPQLIRSDLPILVGVTVFATAMLADRALGRAEGAVLLAGLVLYVGFSLRAVRRVPTPAPDEAPPAASGPLWRDGLAVGAGLALLVAGATGLVEGATGLAEAFGVPATLVGLTVVAIGTSLPELATSVVAAVRGEGDLALGNAIGSNLFNLMGILGVAALVRPLTAPGLALADLAAMMMAAALLLPLALTRRRLNRAEAATLLVLYAAYMISLALR